MNRNEIVEHLASKGVKPTANRILVLKALHEANRPMSLKALEMKLLSMDKSSIFRVLTLFLEHEVVHSSYANIMVHASTTKIIYTSIARYANVRSAWKMRKCQMYNCRKGLRHMPCRLLLREYAQSAKQSNTSIKSTGINNLTNHQVVNPRQLYVGIL